MAKERKQLKKTKTKTITKAKPEVLTPVIEKRPKIVCIGCGTGQSTLLRELKNTNCELTAIVGVTDNGGHSGLLRKILNIPQVGDTRSCLAALGEHGHPLTKLLNYRFATNKLEGMSIGNLMIAALALSENSISRAVNALRKMMDVRHKIFPVSDGNTDICAELKEGKIIVGEWDIMNREPREEIRRLFHKESIDAHPYALKQIEEADMILICPGSLRTGVISILLAKGVTDAVRRSKARKVYICNLMTQPGQTDGFSSNDHINELAAYFKSPLDYALVNTGNPDEELVKRYAKTGSEPVKVSRTVPASKVKIIKGNFVEQLDARDSDKYNRPGKFQRQWLHYIRHDARKTIEAVMELVR